MSTLGQFHVFSAIMALVSGAWVLLRPKGTALHRRIGWVYAVSMIALNVSALWIYRLTGTFGPFHFAALLSLATLVVGIANAWRRRPGDRNWLARHYFYMSYSYLGLVAAAVAETATRIPTFDGGPTPAFWIAVGVASALVFVVGGYVVRRRAESIIRPFQR